MKFERAVSLIWSKTHEMFMVSQQLLGEELVMGWAHTAFVFNEMWQDRGIWGGKFGGIPTQEEMLLALKVILESGLALHHHEEYGSVIPTELNVSFRIIWVSSDSCRHSESFRQMLDQS